MSDRKKHPSKEIETVIRFAEENGWRVIASGNSAHCWGRLFCPYGDRNQECRCGDFCTISVWSTPRSTENHAKQLRRAVEKCILKGEQ